jgi:hypothetical protein
MPPQVGDFDFCLLCKTMIVIFEKYSRKMFKKKKEKKERKEF